MLLVCNLLPLKAWSVPAALQFPCHPAAPCSGHLRRAASTGAFPLCGRGSLVKTGCLAKSSRALLPLSRGEALRGAAVPDGRARSPWPWSGRRSPVTTSLSAIGRFRSGPPRYFKSLKRWIGLCHLKEGIETPHPAAAPEMSVGDGASPWARLVTAELRTRFSRAVGFHIALIGSPRLTTALAAVRALLLFTSSAKWC